MSISERISNAINAIKALSAQNGGGSDTTKIDSDAECQKLSELLSRTDIELTSEEREAILGLKVEYKSNKINNSQQTETPQEAADDNEETTETGNNYDIEDAGKDVQFLLSHWTTSSNATVIEGKLKSIKSDNVLDFLKGYYEKDVNPTEGLIEKLDDDASPEVTMGTKKKLIKAILAKAKECGLEDDPSYKQIEKIMKLYNTTYTGEKEFNKQYTRASYWDHEGKWGSVAGGAAGGAAIGAGIGSFFGGIGAIPGTVIGGAIGLIGGWASGLADLKTDNEVLDDAIQDLYQKMTGAE